MAIRKAAIVKGQLPEKPAGINPLDRSIHWAPFSQISGDLMRRTYEDISSEVAFVGLNRSGKTSTLNYPRLAILGKLPRATTHLAEVLAQSALDPSRGFHVEAAGADGLARFTCPPTGKTILSPFTGRLAALEDYRDTLIVSDVADKLLSPTADVGREALIRVFGADVDMPDLQLDDELESLWQEAASELNLEGAPTAADLSRIAEWLRSAAARATKTARKAEAQLEGARAATASADAVNLDDLRAAWDHAVLWEAHDTMEQCEPLLAQQTTVAKIQRLDVLTQWWSKVAEPMAATGGGACIACGSKPCKTCGTLQTLTPADILDIGNSFSALLARRKAEVTASPEAIQDAVTRYEAAKLQANGQPRPENAPVDSAVNLKRRLEAIRVARMSTDVSASYYEARRQAEERAKACNFLLAEVERAEIRVLTDVAEVARMRMASFMYDVTPTVEIHDKRLDWRVVGAHGGVAQRGLDSGKETVLLELALSVITSPTSFRLFMADDDRLGRLDHHTLPAYLDTIGAARRNGDLTQVLVAWNRPHELMHLAETSGWQIIQC